MPEIIRIPPERESQKNSADVGNHPPRNDSTVHGLRRSGFVVVRDQVSSEIPCVFNR